MGDPWRFCVDAAPAKLEHMTSWGGGGRRGSTGTGAPQVRQRGATGAGGGGRGGFTGAGVAAEGASQVRGCGRGSSTGGLQGLVLG